MIDIQIAKEQLNTLNEKEDIIRKAQEALLEGHFERFLQLGSNGKEKNSQNT